MIPKIIHYCWFGNGKPSKLMERCLASWKTHCPDYEIREWNETNFDIHSNRYVEEAYAARKFAFVSDYVRLYALYTCGGIYMDTDVELVRSPETLLSHTAVCGFESAQDIGTGFMAAEPQLSIFKDLLSYYDTRPFVRSDGGLDTTTNVETITRILADRGFVSNGKQQEIDGFMLYPRDLFSPLDDATGKLHKTKDTIAIHWFNKSWIDPKYRLRSKLTRPFHRLFGDNCFAWLKRR